MYESSIDLIKEMQFKLTPSEKIQVLNDCWTLASMARVYEELSENLPEEVQLLILRHVSFEQLVFLDFVSQPIQSTLCPAN